MPSRRGPATTGRVAELDGLRGLACLLVLVWHYFTSLVALDGPAWSAAHDLTGLAWSGVDLFFVLSGFLVGGILIDRRDSTSFYRTFYVRRACRILPLYFLFLAAYALYAAFGPPDSPTTAWLTRGAHPLWSYALFVQNFSMAARDALGATGLGPTWSIAIEEQFYLLAPLLVRAVAPRRLPAVLVILIVVAPLARTVATLAAGHGLVATYVLLPLRWDSLLLGMLGAWGLRRHPRALGTARAQGYLWAAFAILGCGVVGLGAANPNYHSLGISTWGFTWIAAFYLALLLLATTSPLVRPLFALRPLAFLGTLSYGIYLFHQDVSAGWHALVRHATPAIREPDDALVCLAALVLTVALAWVLHRWIEAPFIRRGHRLNWEK